jgi:hypothetical protein
VPGAGPRLLLFLADEVELGLEIKLEVSETNGRITLAGRLASIVKKALNNLPVRLESPGVEPYRTCTNDSDQFRFEIPNGTYNLSIDIDEAQIIFDVYPPPDVGDHFLDAERKEF